MSLYVPRVGQRIFLEAGVNKTAGQDLIYKLFTNTVTPADTDVAGTYTEAGGGGYVQKAVAGSSWTTTLATPSSMASAELVWSFTGALTTNPNVKGYFVVQALSGILLLSEAEATFTPAGSGDNIHLTPTITGTHT